MTHKINYLYKFESKKTGTIIYGIFRNIDINNDLAEIHFNGDTYPVNGRYSLVKNLFNIYEINNE